MRCITRLQVSGFKSIEHMDLALEPLNVLIGANGAGKSNLLAALKLLRRIGDGTLESHVAESGSASALLFRGPKHTQEIKLRVDGEDASLGDCFYEATLRYAQGDKLQFAEERYGLDMGAASEEIIELGGGDRESRLLREGRGRNNMAQFLDSLRVFHFVDTTPEAAIRQHVDRGGLGGLRPNGGNLAAFLEKLSRNDRNRFDRIQSTIRLVAPWFRRFSFEVDHSSKSIDLGWRGDDPGYVFMAHQLPDGALRAMALIALLLSLDANVPWIVAIDEPELGLHPSAISIVAELIHEVTYDHQVILATQSVTLLEQFEPDEIVVVERHGAPTIPNGLFNPSGYASSFKRLSEDDLTGWLEAYSIGQLWERGTIGGGPF